MHVQRWNPGIAPGRTRTRTPQDLQIIKDAGQDLALGSVDPDFESFGLPPSKNFAIGDSLTVNLGGDGPVADYQRRMW